jgi:hypothetical protein
VEAEPFAGTLPLPPPPQQYSMALVLPPAAPPSGPIGGALNGNDSDSSDDGVLKPIGAPVRGPRSGPCHPRRRARTDQQGGISCRWGHPTRAAARRRAPA